MYNYGSRTSIAFHSWVLKYVLERNNMKNMQDLIEQMNHLKRILSVEIQKKQDEFLYKIEGKRIKFEEATRRYHKTLVTRIPIYILKASLLNLLIAPVIWFCIVPTVFMDLVASVYQFICFPVYKIPKVRRDDYIVVDRHALEYLNALEKLNCVYCGYVNGLIAYIQEIGARTEQYWCPIKHARKIGDIHSRYKNFLEYGDAEEYSKNMEKIRRDFDDL